MWIIFSFGAAFFQAANMALKKKALQFKGVNNFIAFISFLIAGTALLALIIIKGQPLLPAIENLPRFWWGLLAGSVIPNTFAVYFLYKALDITDLSHLMPFIALTTIFSVIPPIFIFGEIPSIIGFLGIAIIVFGAIMMEYKKKAAIQTAEDIEKRKKNRKGVIFFLITLLFWVITPTGFKMVVEQTNGLYASAIISLFVSLSFIPLVVVFREKNAIRKLLSQGTPKIFAIAIIFAGLFIAGEFLAMNSGFALSKVSYVMAIKRTMPFFAFLIGYLYFKERTNAMKKLTATAIMIAGAILISIFE